MKIKKELSKLEESLSVELRDVVNDSKNYAIVGFSITEKNPFKKFNQQFDAYTGLLDKKDLIYFSRIKTNYLENLTKIDVNFYVSKDLDTLFNML
jgi:hypothetical protein